MSIMYPILLHHNRCGVSRKLGVGTTLGMHKDGTPIPQEHPELSKTGSAAEERTRLAEQEEGRVAHEPSAAPDREPVEKNH
jgi:hypothetical protein